MLVCKTEMSSPKKQDIFVFLFILHVLALQWLKRWTHVALLNT